MYAHSVQIGPEFFRKAFDDYGDRHWAFAREIMQNSIDCGSRDITVTLGFNPEAGDTTVTVVNDGEPMTDEILVNKLLSLGSSGKDFAEGQVGGFGKAKEILYFAHEAYAIHSGDWTVTGSGAGYDLARRDTPIRGTTSIVRWAGRAIDGLEAAFDTFIRLCSPDMKVKFTLNGHAIKGEVRVGDVERTLNDDQGNAWADVRLSKSRHAKYLVRIGGIPMFWGHCDHRGLVVLDLHGTSASKMTSNRDALKYPFGNQFSEFITTIAIDKHTAFKLEKATYKRFAGNKLSGRIIDPQAMAAQSVPEGVRIAAYVEARPSKGGAGILVEEMGREEAVASVLGHEFIIKNCVRRELPEEFDPDSLAFSDHAHWLVRAWAGCLVELHRLHGIGKPFSVGFIQAEDVVAEVEYGHADFGLVYYLNPVVVGKRRSTRRYAKRSRHDILAVAAHEFVHGGMDVGYHGETFAGRITEVMGLVMKHSRRFTRHLQ